MFSALALTVVVGACQRQPRHADRGPHDERIVVLLPEAIKGTLDPRLNTRAWAGKLIHLMFEGLVSVNNDELEPRPALASKIEQPQPHIYDVTIRANARFHDGSPVTAHDVVATYASVRNPEFRSPYRSMYTRVERMEILGPKRLRLVLDGPHAPFMSDLSLGILPVASIDGRGNVTGRLIGAGPYALSARYGAQEIVLERNPHYHRGLPATERLIFRAIPDQNSRLLALLGGSGDMVQNAVSPILVDAMRKRAGLTVDEAAGVGYSYLAFNLRDPILADVRVRRAIAHAIDRDKLIRYKFRGLARAATGMLPDGHWAYGSDVARYPYDPPKARALLDAAGHPRSGDDGGRFRLSYTTSTDKFRRNVATLIARSLADVGIEVEVRAFELGTLLSDVKAGNFQMYSLHWGDPSEPHFYSWIFDSKRVPTPLEPNRGGNRGAYVNPRVDALIERGRRDTDRDGRRRIYREIQAIVATDLPYLSLWHEDVVVVRRAALTGYRALPNASLYGLWQARWARGQP